MPPERAGPLRLPSAAPDEGNRCSEKKDDPEAANEEGEERCLAPTLLLCLVTAILARHLLHLHVDDGINDCRRCRREPLRGFGGTSEPQRRPLLDQLLLGRRERTKDRRRRRTQDVSVFHHLYLKHTYSLRPEPDWRGPPERRPHA